MDLDELAQADAEAGYGFWTTCAFKKRMGFACDGTEHDYSLAQTEADVAEYFWNSCAFKKAMGEECDGDSLAQIVNYSEADFLNCYFWNECDGLAQTEAVAQQGGPPSWTRPS